jgi:alpha-tubulin suppressor-like RCC1 family protein
MSCQKFAVKLPVLLLLMIISCCSLFIQCTRKMDAITNPVSVPIIPGFDGILETNLDFAVVKPNGSVWVWGSNTTGLAGNGTMEPSWEPTPIRNMQGVVALDFLAGMGVAADVSGNIWYWGDPLIYLEFPEQIVTPTPHIISSLKNVVQIQIYANTIYMLREDGTVWTLLHDHWHPTEYLEPKRIDRLQNVKQISGALVLKSDGTIDRLFDKGGFEIPAGLGGVIEGLDEFSMIGNMVNCYTIALKNDGTVWAWGRNISGNLGTGDSLSTDIPIRIKDLQNMKAVSVEGTRCLALDEEGCIWFWGLEMLALDENVKEFQDKPVKIDYLRNVQLIKVS